MNARGVLASRWLSLGTGLLLAAMWGLFARVHWAYFQRTHEPAMLLFVAAEGLAALFFVIRRAPASVSTRPLDWAAGFVGTFLPLLLRPAAAGLFPGAHWVLSVGVALQLGAILSLNRSFALVAARRALKTRGFYRVVRHPMYACYLLTFAGYVSTYASARNAGVVAGVALLNLLRLHREEAQLAEDPAWEAYAARVRWRLIPFVY